MQPTPRLRVLSDRIHEFWCLSISAEGYQKYRRKAHMSGLRRDISAPRNFLPSRRLQKPREESRGRKGPGQGARPEDLGARPPLDSVRDSLRTRCSTDLLDQG